MAKNEKEYAELLSLRDDLIIRDVANDEYEAAKKRYDNYTFNRQSPSSINVSSNTRRLIELFEAPTVNVEKAKAAKRDKFLNFFKNLFLIIVAIGVLILGTWLIKLSAVWSWNTSITDMVTDIYMTEIITYDIAVGIHLFALFFVLAVAALICGFMAMSIEPIFATGSVAFGLCGVVSLFASFKYFYSAATGFWNGVTYFFSALLYTPKFFKTLIYVFPFCLAILGTVALVALLLYLCTKGVVTKIDTYEKPPIDLTKLKATPEYKAAEKRDAEATEKARAEYTIVYNKAKLAFNEKKEQLRLNVNRYAGIYNDCQKRIKATKCVPNDKKTFEWVSIILHYIDNGTARDSVEALREYKHDLEMKELRQAIEDMKRRHERELEDAYESGYRKAKGEAAAALRSVMRENERLEEALERSDREFNDKCRRLEEDLARNERELRYNYDELRLLRNVCERGW